MSQRLQQQKYIIFSDDHILNRLKIGLVKLKNIEKIKVKQNNGK